MVSPFLRKRLFVFTLTAAGALVGCSGEPWGNIGAGDRAPDFSLQDVSGRRLSLGDAKGKVVLLDFWATYCEPCRASIPFFEELHGEQGKDGLLILGINEDVYTGHVKDFLKETGITYTVLMDSGQTAARRYGVRKFPETFLIDRTGVVRKKWIGFAPGHAAEIRTEVETYLKKAGGN